MFDAGVAPIRRGSAAAALAGPAAPPAPPAPDPDDAPGKRTFYEPSL
jgi:hypothetical protein